MQLQTLLQISHNLTFLPDAEHLHASVQTLICLRSLQHSCNLICLIKADECAEYEGILSYTSTTPGGLRISEAHNIYPVDLWNIIWMTFWTPERYLQPLARITVSWRPLMAGYCDCKSFLAAFTCLSLSHSPLTRISLSWSVKLKIFEPEGKQCRTITTTTET